MKGHGVKAGDGSPGDLFAELQIVLPPKLADNDREQLATIARKYADNPRADLTW